MSVAVQAQDRRMTVALQRGVGLLPILFLYSLQEAALDDRAHLARS